MTTRPAPIRALTPALRAILVAFALAAPLSCGGGEAPTETPQASSQTPTAAQGTPAARCDEDADRGLICESCIKNGCGDEHFQVYGEDFPGAPDGVCRIFLDCKDACACDDDLCAVECTYNRSRPCTQAIAELERCEATRCAEVCAEPEPTPGPALWCEIVDGSLVPPTPVNGSFGPETPTDGVVTGTPFARYSLELERNRKIQIDMTSADFDTYLILLDSRCNLVTLTDDGAGGTDARLSYSSQVGGRFYVEATTREIAAQGDYSLVGSYAICDEVVKNIGLGQTVTGNLESTDRSDGVYDGAYYDLYGLLLDGEPPHAMRLNLEGMLSSQALILRDKGCNVVAEGVGRVTYTAEGEGPYYIEVSGKSPEVTGAYTLEAQGAGP